MKKNSFKKAIKRKYFNKFFITAKMDINKFIHLIKRRFCILKKCKYFKLIALLVLITLIGIIILIISISNIKKSETKYFQQFFLGNEFSYKAKIKYDKNNNINDFKVLNYKIDYFDAPIYYKYEKKVLFSKKHSIILLNNNHQYLIDENSIITILKDKSKLKNKEINNYIVFNGNDTFFFSESSILYINSEFKLDLAPYSYCKLWNDKVIECVDYKSKKSKVIDINGSVIIQIGNRKINLGFKSIVDNNSEFLLQTNFKDLKEMSGINE